MWNWESGKEASRLVSSTNSKSIGDFLQTSLNRVILFLKLSILRYPMMGLLVYNFLKFISPSMTRLWFAFLALLLIWLVTVSHCFLKFALNPYYIHWVEKAFCAKNCLEIFGNCDRIIPVILFFSTKWYTQWKKSKIKIHSTMHELIFYYQKGKRKKYNK